MILYFKLSCNEGQIKNGRFSKVGNFEFTGAGIEINFTSRKGRADGHFLCAILNCGARIDYAFHFKGRNGILAQLALNAGNGGFQAADSVMQLLAQGEDVLDGGFAGCLVSGDYFFIRRISHLVVDVA